MNPKPRVATAARQATGKATVPPAPTVSLVGVGAMGSALGRGWMQSGVLPPERLTFFDPADGPARAFEKATGAKRVPTLAWALGAQVVVFCVKPQQMQAVLQEVAAPPQEAAVWVSVAAGVSLASLREWSGFEHWMRAMPNLACAHRRGVTGLVKGKFKGGLAAVVEQLFAAVGTVVAVNEEKMHAVTALAGSGPALVLAALHALAQGGVWSGLSYADALSLAVGATDSALALLEHEQQHPAQLISRVTSPAGTTIAALAALEAGGGGAALMQSVKAAADRSRELSG